MKIFWTFVAQQSTKYMWKCLILLNFTLYLSCQISLCAFFKTTIKRKTCFVRRKWKVKVSQSCLVEKILIGSCHLCIFIFFEVRCPQVIQSAVVQLLSCVWFFVTAWTAACQDPLSSTVSWSLLRFMSIHVLSHHLMLCHPLLLFLQPFPVLGSFTVSQLFASGGQSIGVSTSATFLPVNIQGPSGVPRVPSHLHSIPDFS